jgi:hypothetical protein
MSGEKFKYQKNCLLQFYFSKRIRLLDGEYRQLDQWFPKWAAPPHGR